MCEAQQVSSDLFKYLIIISQSSISFDKWLEDMAFEDARRENEKMNGTQSLHYMY